MLIVSQGDEHCPWITAVVSRDDWHRPWITFVASEDIRYRPWITFRRSHALGHRPWTVLLSLVALEHDPWTLYQPPRWQLRDPWTVRRGTNETEPGLRRAVGYVLPPLHGSTHDTAGVALARSSRGAAEECSPGRFSALGSRSSLTLLSRGAAKDNATGRRARTPRVGKLCHGTPCRPTDLPPE